MSPGTDHDRDVPRPDDGDEMTTEDERELLEFEARLGPLLRGETLRSSELPPELEARLVRMTREYRPDESYSWAFLAGFLVIVAGVWGAAVWTPLILIGIAVFALVVVGADRLARRLRDRSLLELLAELRN